MPHVSTDQDTESLELIVASHSGKCKPLRVLGPGNYQFTEDRLGVNHKPLELKHYSIGGIPKRACFTRDIDIVEALWFHTVLGLCKPHHLHPQICHRPAPLLTSSSALP